MVLKRKIYKSFLDWKANWAGKRALLVQGARRIGKSTIVEEFAKNEYETYILINFQSDLGIPRSNVQTKGIRDIAESGYEVPVFPMDML